MILFALFSFFCHAFALSHTNTLMKKFGKMFYSVGADVRRQYSLEEEDDLLQFAVQQSLVDAGTEREEVCSLKPNYIL